MEPQNEQASLLLPPQSNTVNDASSETSITSSSLTDRITRWFDDEMYRKFVYMLFWSLVTGYFTGVTNAIADNRAILYYDNSNQGLGDVGIDFVHDSLGIGSGDINAKSDAFCVYTQLSLFFIFVLILKLSKIKSNRQCIMIIIEFALFINILFTLRILNICLTSFPSPSDQVVWQNCSEWDNIWVAPFLIISGQKASCHDFCFSGHTIVTTVCALMLTKHSYFMYNNNNWWIISTIHWKIIRIALVTITWCIAFLTILFLLVLELHYSIDITVALMLTIVIWNLAQAQMKYKYGLFGWWIKDVNKEKDDGYTRIE